MEQSGFLCCFPVVCVRDEHKNLVVLDGQHRLAFAETLGLVVWYIVMPDGFDIPTVNNTQEKWTTRNFAETYAAKGKKAYQEGLEFADRHGIAVGTAFGLLAGTSSWTNASSDYYTGNFKIKDRAWAESVGTLYSHLVSLSPCLKNVRLLEACMCVARVEGFDPQRLIGGADRCREKLTSYSTRDAYLELLEELYNFGRKSLVGLKIAAITIMRDRNCINKGKK